VSAVDEPLARTVSAQIRIRIREKILSGAYPPGSQLLQDSIAAEFGTSKIPVREALLQLRSEGLVDIFAHRGFQVRPLSKAEVAEVFRLRLNLEPPAAAKGARAAAPQVQRSPLVLRQSWSVDGASIPPKRIRLLPIRIESPSRIFGTPVISAAPAKAGGSMSRAADNSVFSFIGNPGKGWCPSGGRIVRTMRRSCQSQTAAVLSTSRHCEGRSGRMANSE